CSLGSVSESVKVSRVASYSSPQMISRRTFITSLLLPANLLAPLAIGPRCVGVAGQRIDQNPLRTTGGADGLQTVVANPVVDGSSRHSEQLSRVVQRNAAADMRFELALGVGGHPGCLTPSINAREVPVFAIQLDRYISRLLC